MDQQQIIADLEARARAAGLNIAEACARADLHPTTFSRWKRSDKNPNPVNANLGSLNRLREAIESAESPAQAAPAPAEARAE